ncbi:MAG TPA: hypothetical protein VFK16_10700 [Gemmatimonadaceae bacterium]|nr:hypothetical protein [Gemmatimonadaceae bacterium]
MYISKDEIAAVELFSSAAFVDEPFLVPFKHVKKCFYFLLFWSTHYQQHAYGGG